MVGDRENVRHRARALQPRFGLAVYHLAAGGRERRLERLAAWGARKVRPGEHADSVPPSNKLADDAGERGDVTTTVGRAQEDAHRRAA